MFVFRSKVRGEKASAKVSGAAYRVTKDEDLGKVRKQECMKWDKLKLAAVTRRAKGN
jgi:hypothetical protein